MEVVRTSASAWTLAVRRADDERERGASDARAVASRAEPPDVDVVAVPLARALAALEKDSHALDASLERAGGGAGSGRASAGDAREGAVARAFEREDARRAVDSLELELELEDARRVPVGVVPETELPGRSWGESEGVELDARGRSGAEASPSASGGEGRAMDPSPGVSARVAGAIGVGVVNPFAHTPTWPRTQAAPETEPRGRTRFVYFRDDEDEATPLSRRRDVPASAPRAGAAAVQSPFVIMQRYESGAMTPYANIERAAPASMTMTTASGRKVIARTDAAASEPRWDGNAAEMDDTPRFDDVDDDAFTFRAVIETPATAANNAAAPLSGGLFTTGSGAPVSVSADAMRRARSILADVDESPTIPAVSGSGLTFQTGRGANVAVSDEAMRRARAMFSDGAVENERPSTSGRGAPGGFSFQTAGGTALNVSEEAMQRSRAMFADVGNEDVHTPANARSRFPQPSFKTPKSLPAARKAPGFTPPLRPDAFKTPISKLGVDTSASRQAKRARFGPGGSGKPVHDLFAARVRMGKRAPLCTFFDGLLPFQKSPSYVDACVKTLNADTAKSLRLPSVERGLVGWREMRELMIKAGACESLLTNEWASNAYKWIVWTQACVARAFPERYAFGVLSESAVLQRMLYKYEREINRAERSHLKKVLERDANAGEPAVYVVSAIRSMTTTTTTGATPTVSEIEVTDGWYGVRARLDAKLTQHVREGRLRVGSKIFAVGAELKGVTDAVSPLSEEAEMAYLCLHVNGARPAPWDATLGRVGYNLTVPLRTVVPDGGIVPRMLIRIRHVYPMMHQERRDEDKSVMRCDIAERRAFAQWQRARDHVLHEIQDAAQNQVGGWGAGADPERVVKEALEEKNLYERRTSMVLRLNVVGFNPSKQHASYRGPLDQGVSSAVLTIWDVDETLLDVCSPGQTFAVTALKPRANAFLPGEINLSTTRFTRWTPVSPIEIEKQNLAPSEPDWRCMSVQADVDLGDLARSGLPRKEFDVVACAVHCGPPRSTQHGRLSQWIFFLDASAPARSKQAGSKTDASPYLLAVEVCGYDDDSFVDAEDWMSSSSPFWSSRSECGPPLVLQNLEYQRHDSENDVYVARLLMENVSVSAATTSADPRVASAARELERWRLAPATSRATIAALKKRARYLTGANDEVNEPMDLGPWDEANASQRPASEDEYDPPRLSSDWFDNDENASAILINTAEEAARLTRSAKKRSAPAVARPEETTPRRSSRGR